ncbi:MAG: mannonate dehydratase [Christensenellales bacterium]|mgnify:CR=1 FL=1|jgi:mannonate dehydratase|nr:TIM barrel protein [Christensenellaceae bacterium]
MKNAKSNNNGSNPSMILTDYLIPNISSQWRLAKQVGVNHATVRLPDDGSFDVTNLSQMMALSNLYLSYQIKPIIIEPLPNSLHDHIKCGDNKRDESIEKVIKMIPILAKCGYRVICVNFMAKIGWFRTSTMIEERGGAKVTGFNIADAQIDPSLEISEKELWDNLSYFLRAVVPIAEKHDVSIALHPDDPPIKKLGNISRILISKNNLQKALDIYPSKNLGITMCQATFAAMGEDVCDCIEHFGFQGKIKFVHFRDIRGTKECFHETFHDNGMTDMDSTIKQYKKIGYKGPIRVDHVPSMEGEKNDKPGYETIGRLYAIGYLRGLCEANGYNLE